MDSVSKSESDRLGAALVAAFPPYVVQRLAELGVPAASRVAKAIDEATNQLAAGLAELLAMDASDQQESPLELVRRATVPISAALDALAVHPAERDEWEVATHPEDRYGLYPASSEELGEEAWQLHLQWGIRKAQLVAGMVPASDVPVAPRMPSVGLFGVPVEDRAELVEAISSLGYEALVWRNPAALSAASVEHAVLVVVDLRHPRAHETIRQVADTGVRTVATSDHVEDLIMPGLRALGAEEVVELGRLVVRLERLLPRLV